MDFLHAIRDPIQGYVRLTASEVRGLDTPELQRLRRISQLGLTEMVYPGARHSRFEHALGTLEVATRTLEGLRGRLGLGGLMPVVGLAPESAEFDRLLALARWVALLHDVGHAPFSHTTEDLLPEGRSHEIVTLSLVDGGALASCLAEADPELATEVRQVLRSVTAGARADAGSLAPHLAFVRELIAGPLGADRMDYLLRDSAATGVSYGIFDLARVLHTLIVVPWQGAPRLGVDRGGMLAVEGMLWGRVSMFQQVYLHRTRRILDRHLVDFLRAVLPGGCYPEAGADYLDWTDARVWELLRERAHGGDLPGGLDAQRILTRRHHRALAQELESSDRAQLGAWLEEWSARVVRAAPDADPRIDVVDPPSLGLLDAIPVRTGTGSLEALRNQSALLAGLRLRPVGRLYVACGTPAVPTFP